MGFLRTDIFIPTVFISSTMYFSTDGTRAVLHDLQFSNNLSYIVLRLGAVPHPLKQAVRSYFPIKPTFFCLAAPCRKKI